MLPPVYWCYNGPSPMQAVSAETYRKEPQAGRPSLHPNLLQRQPRCGRAGQLHGLVTRENGLLGLHNSVLYKTKVTSGQRQHTKPLENRRSLLFALGAEGRHI